MIFSDLPFKELRRVLLALGFVEHVLQGKYLAFDQRETDTTFFFRLYGPEDMVLAADIVTVRNQLDWRGLLNREAFDASLRKASA